MTVLRSMAELHRPGFTRLIVMGGVGDLDVLRRETSSRMKRTSSSLLVSYLFLDRK